MATHSFTSVALDELADYLVSDRDTHKVLDRRFAELGIEETILKRSEEEEDYYRSMGMQRSIHYSVIKPSKRDRLRHALRFQFNRSGNSGVLQLIKLLNEPVIYSENPEGFRDFCAGLNRILRFCGVEYRDDGQFHNVDPTRTLSEAERRAAALENKLRFRRIHHEVRRYCKAEYMEENYFHAVVEAYKGLAERIREQTGYSADGLALMRKTFERPSQSQGGYSTLAFNTLVTVSQKNEHDGFLDLLSGCTRFFRNPMSHTPKIKWHRNIEDAVDCLTLISLLHFILDDCHPTMPTYK
ncbi:MAG: TIGR02391 family protein [Chloroflexi bacterium]|nr:TIGR02391 family protein [Chloroflexota bacterium]